MILATAGHIDHGKTALVRALTGIDADRLPEEKRRGMTIDLGFAYASLPDGGEIGFVDVPGHERFLPNMLAGVLGIDRVLLVVAADDGPRPQTLEHLDILELVGIGEITGIVTKIDRVPPERTAAVAAELRALLAEAGFSESPIFAVSSQTGEGIPALVHHLEERAREAARPRTEAAPGLFRMPIDRAFTLSGIGLVATGTIAAGTVSVGDHLLSSPRGLALRVRGLHARNRPVERAGRGERCAVNIAGAFPEGGEPRRGDWLLAAERHAPTGRLDLWVRASRLAPAPLRDGLPVHLHLGTEDVVGRLGVLAGQAMAPGESGFVQLDVEHPIGALYGDRAVLRDHAARHTLAGGSVVDPFAPRRGRRTPARLALLAAMAEPDAARSLDRRLALEGIVDLARFALSRNLTPEALDAIVAGMRGRRIGRPPALFAVGEERFAALGEGLVEALARFHREMPDLPGPSRSELFARLSGAAPEPVLAAVLAALAAAGRVARVGAAWHLSEHRARLSAADERLWERILPLLAAGGLRPPRVRELAQSLRLDPTAVGRFLARAERFGRVAKVADNRYFLPEVLASLADIARELAAAAPDGTFTAAAFKDRAGVGRNLAIEILEFLDKIGATRRVGDARLSLRGGELFG
ncbi:MAG TPA: selenocysteine-specific translation elongation factor [Stellaceae bacterium]|nr:selenocysteine-specific translation elongation factor [Stellaceae bacterium]